MAANTKKTSTETTEEISTAARIAAEEAERPQRPDGAPSLKPFSMLSRRERADFQSTWSAHIPGSMLASEGGELDIAETGISGLFQIVADMEDALALVAIHRDMFREWAKGADDETLQELFRWYQATQASGE